MLRILLAGSDSRLLATRAAVLLKTGAVVVYRDTMGTLNILDREAFDLVVLCHTLPEEDVAVIVDKVHQKIPGAKTADPRRFIDSTILDELEKEGFLKTLYRN